MGRQIAVAMSGEDEERFLAFLRESADISIYRSWSPTPNSDHNFSKQPQASPFHIHNKAFQWEPEFQGVEYADRNTGQSGIYYRLANVHGPLLEYSRHPLHALAPQVSGRLYWSKSFAASPRELLYDTTAFEVWYSSVASWVRRHARRVSHGTTEPWCFRGAWLLLKNEA